jgi:cold shock CspA family protein
MRPYAVAIAIALADGLSIGVHSADHRSRRALVRMRAVPGTLQFSAFKGYFVSTDDGADVPIAKERIGKGLDMGDRVEFDPDADAAGPLVRRLSAGVLNEQPDGPLPAAGASAGELNEQATQYDRAAELLPQTSLGERYASRTPTTLALALAPALGLAPALA